MKDLSGSRFQHLTVLEFIKKKKLVNKNSNWKYCSWWKCQCDCGRMVTRTNFSLKDSSYNYCGSCDFGFKKFKDRSGETHGLLKVISLYGIDKSTSTKAKSGIIYTTYWNCLCECGESCIRSVKNFNLKYSLHCGKITCKRRITSCSWKNHHFMDSQQNSEQSINF